jgi:hypothetical protein
LTEAVRDDLGGSTELERFGAADFNDVFYKDKNNRDRLAYRILGLPGDAPVLK